MRSTGYVSRLVTAAVVLATATVASGCSVSIGGPPVMSKASLQSKLQSMMSSKTGRSWPVACPGDLTGVVGRTSRCVWKAPDGSTLGITVTVRSVSGQEIGLQAQADSHATPAPSTS